MLSIGISPKPFPQLMNFQINVHNYANSMLNNSHDLEPTVQSITLQFSKLFKYVASCAYPFREHLTESGTSEGQTLFPHNTLCR